MPSWPSNGSKTTSLNQREDSTTRKRVVLVGTTRLRVVLIGLRGVIASAFLNRRTVGLHRLVVILLVVSTGCGSTDGNLSEVRGEITFSGKPAVAEVVFEPILTGNDSGGRASTATSDASGRFRLMLDESRPGARIGRHRVTIRVLSIATESATKGSAENPDRAVGALKVSQFSREVKASGNQFHFRITL